MYVAKFLSWCKTYDQEVKEMINLIKCNPCDVQQLKKEFKELTGKRYRDSK